MTPSPEEQNDLEIDRILAALRSADPSPGMQRRILHTLETHPATPPPRRWLIPVLTGAAAAGLLTFALLPPHPRPASTSTVATQNVPPTAVITTHASATHPAQTVSLRPRPTSVPVVTEQPASEPNHPAAPMPLTDQERLLVRLAQRSRPQDVIALSPQVAELQQAHDLAAFDAFFQQILLPAFNANPEPSTDQTPTPNPDSGDDPWQPAARN